MFTWKRRTIDLNGKWKFCPDPMQRCRRQQWWRNPTKRDGVFPCWDVDGLWDIAVPGTWKTQFEQLKWYDGHAVYMRDFKLDEIPEGHEAYLVFDGIVYASQVYLNGQLAGEHDWGYSSFQLHVTKMLRERNRLFVLVENLPRKDRVPGEIHDWNNDGGIINGVKLVFVPMTHIHNFRVETKLSANLYVNDLKEAEIAYPRYVDMFRKYNKPLILSEFGSMSLRGCNMPADRLGSEGRHANLLDGTFRILERLPELVGYCPWCLNDVRVPIHWRWYNEGKGVFRYGVLDENYDKKEKVFAALKKSIARIKARFARNIVGRND
jgi:hypothetical protein